MNKRSIFYMCSLFLIAMLSFSTASTYAVGEKDTLIIGMQDDTVYLDPAKSNEASALGTLGQLYEKLVNFKEGDLTQPIPELAESWELKDDGKTWIFHVRQEASFSSGNPVNAEAVVFSLRRAIKLANDPSWILTQFGMTEESVTKIDDHTVQIVLDQQYAPALFLSCLTTFVASILDPKVVMEHEQDTDMGTAWLENHSAGSGPYVLAERRQDTLPVQYVLESNENYWRKKPIFKKIIVKSIQEPLEQTVMLQNGDIDIAWNLQPDQAKILKGNPAIQISESLTLRITYASMNLDYAPLGKLEVRNAIRYAIDYDGIIEYILQGAGVTIQTVIPKGLLGYNPSMPYKRDLKKAKQLLVEAGYPDGFEVEFACLNYSPWIDVALKIKSDLAEIGIDVKISPMTASKLYEEAIAPRTFQMYMWEWIPDYFDPDANVKVFAHNDSLEDDATITMMAWETKYMDLERSKLVEQAARELDQEKREQLYKQITDTVLKEGPFVLLYTPIKQYGVRSEIREFIQTSSILWSAFPELK